MNSFEVDMMTEKQKQRFRKAAEKGELELLKAAKTGNTDAMLNLGRAYLNGFVLPKNIEEGESWLRKAAQSGNLEALTVLGHEYLTGNKLTQNIQKGEKQLREAANAGNMGAILTLSFYYLEGEALPQNRIEGERWLKKAANKGNLYAMKELETLKKKENKLSRSHNMEPRQEVYVQNLYLNKLIETETPVKIFMVNGFQIQGTIKAFDMYSISVQSNDKHQLIFKQAIRTIQPDKPIDWRQEEK